MHTRTRLAGIAVGTMATFGAGVAPAAAQSPYYCIPGGPSTSPYYCIPDGGGGGGNGGGGNPGGGNPGGGNPGGGNPGGGGGGGGGSALSISVQPKVDTAPPVAYRVSGRLRTGTRAATSAVRPACRGRVRITVRRNGKPVARKTVRTKQGCRYSTRVKVRRSRLARSGRLTIRARFLGNADTRARSSKVVRVRYSL